MATPLHSTMVFIMTALLSGAGLPVTAAAADVEVPEVPVIDVSPSAGHSNALIPGWEDPPRPAPLGSRERQAILQQVSGGGTGGLPLTAKTTTQGRTPTLRQALLSVKRPWYNQRAFLAGEGVQRVDARSVMRFEESMPGRAIVGMNLLKDTTYLVDFTVLGEGGGEYVVTTEAGAQSYPDPEAELNHVLVAIRAERNGWTEVSLSRTAGAFDLHTVEITLARAPGEAAGSGND